MSNPTISNPTLARKPRIVSSRWIPLTLFVVALLALDLFDFSLQVSGSTLAEIVSTGSAFGQLCFISILAKLYGRCWLAGIPLHLFNHRTYRQIKRTPRDEIPLQTVHQCDLCLGCRNGRLFSGRQEGIG